MKMLTIAIIAILALAGCKDKAGDADAVDMASVQDVQTEPEAVQPNDVKPEPQPVDVPKIDAVKLDVSQPNDSASQPENIDQPDAPKRTDVPASQ